MAKKVKKIQDKKPVSFSGILKGEFIDLKEIASIKWYLLLILLLWLILIFTNHWVSRQVSIVNRLKEQTEEYKSRNAYAQSRLIKIKLESELGKEVMRDSLIPLENHPHKLLIKIDSTNAKTKEKL